MRDFLINLFSHKDPTGGEGFKPFTLTHLFIVLFTIILIVGLYLLFKDATNKHKTKLLDILGWVLLGLYLFDFIVIPFQYAKSLSFLDGFDKLPFHICTSCAILIPVARLTKNNTFKVITSCLGLIGGVVFILYPANLDDSSFLCYYVLQSLCYHIVLTSYSFLSFLFKDVKPNFKYIYVNAIFISIQILIAVFANNIYSIQQGGYPEAHEYNWYFVNAYTMGLPFNAYVMPVVMLLALMAGTFLIYGACYLYNYIKNKNNEIVELFDEIDAHY